MAGPDEEAILNDGYPELLGDLRRAGVEVVDLVPVYELAKASLGKRLFLRTDSHWTPQTMARSAQELALRIALTPREEAAFSTTKVALKSSGDLAALLGVERMERWEEPIEERMLREDGKNIWQSNEESPVLLLGDSFTNVFSLGEMGWGKGAGLAEALSVELGFSVDRIARNADGAFASREELRRHPGRLSGKRVVIWQFAMRELSFGDWRMLDLPSRERSASVDRNEKEVRLTGTIEGVASVPQLTRTPYRQAVMEVLLKEVQSEANLPKRVVVLGLGVDDRQPTAMTKWKVGQQVTIRTIPWKKMAARLGRLHRLALEDPDLELLELPWVWRVVE